MRNEKLAQLIKALKKQVSPEKFNMEAIAIQNNCYISFSDLNKKDFAECGTSACALGWYKLLINPELDISYSNSLEKEFNLDSFTVARFFFSGCIVTAKDGFEYPIKMSEETTLFEWIDAVEAWLDGGKITHNSSPIEGFTLIEA